MTEAKKAKFTLVLPDGSSPLKAPREVFIEQSTQATRPISTSWRAQKRCAAKPTSL